MPASPKVPRWAVLALLLLGVAALAATSRLGPIPHGTRREQAQRRVTALSDGIVLYRKWHGLLPAQADGLHVIFSEGFIDGQLDADPWGHPYRYVVPGKIHPGGFDVVSDGADGQPGGVGENADITN